jgi:hypothetical protein
LRLAQGARNTIGTEDRRLDRVRGRQVEQDQIGIAGRVGW